MRGATATPAHGCRRFLSVAVAAATLVAGAWGWAPHAWASDEATFKAAYEAAVAARKAAASAGFEWGDTKKMLRQARKLGKKGEYAKAVKLANRTKRQAELGLIQAREQESAWEAAVLK